MAPATGENSPQLFSRRALMKGTLAAGGLWLLPGCSPQAQGPDASPSPGLTGNGTPATRAANLQVGVPTDITPEAILRWTPGNRPIRRTVFDVLIDQGPEREYVPSLARDWEWSGDGTVLKIALQEGVTFHSGRPFGADDVLFLIEKATEEGSGAQVAPLLERGNMRKTGDLELTVDFDSPFPSYLDAFVALPVVDSESFDSIADGEELIGTGPFTWQSWTPGSGFEMERYDDYWGGDTAFDHVEMNVIGEPQAMLAAMRSGDIDVVERMTARDAARLEGDGFEVVRSVGFDYYVGVNTAVPPLDDVRVRQAIAYALDRDRIADQVFSGIAEPSSIPWSKDAPGVTDAHVNHYSFNLERAKELLEEAGAVGAEIAITPSPQDPTYSDVADIVNFGLTEIGLKPKPAAVEAAEFPSHMQGGTFPGVWIAIIGLTSLGPTTALMTANPLLGEANSHNFTPPEYRSLRSAVIDAPTEEAKAESLSELTDYMLEQAHHNSVVQASTAVVSTPELSGAKMDVTLALKLTDAEFRA